MIWESVFFIKEQIKAKALVIFFKIKSKKFGVLVQESEVQAFKWVEWKG